MEAVMARDHGQCTEPTKAGRCTATANDVHHIGDPTDHSLENLRAICAPHHDSITGRDANAVRWARTRARAARPTRHPGLTG